MKHNLSADGLRGIAALNVAICHFIEAFYPTMMAKHYPGIFPVNAHPGIFFNIIQSPIISLLYNGQFAVIIFFVLSGYVLTLPYFKDDLITLKKRIWGRYIRLNLPIAVSLMISFFIYKLGGYHNTEAAEVSGSMHWLFSLVPSEITTLDFFKMIFYKSILFGDSSLNTALWTLKIEFIGSVYLLLFFLCCPREHIKLCMFCSMLVLLAYYEKDILYYIAMFSGALINKIKPKNKGFILVLGLYFGAFQTESVIFNFLPRLELLDTKTFYNTIGAFFVTLAIVNGFGRKFFESSMLQFFGKISFSFYLLHPVILLSAACFLYIRFPVNVINLCLIFIAYMILLISAAFLFEVIIDQFAVRLSHRCSNYLISRK